MSKQEAAEFRTRPVVDADYRPDIEYWGASSGIISPGRIARAVFGGSLDKGLDVFVQKPRATKKTRVRN